MLFNSLHRIRCNYCRVVSARGNRQHHCWLYCSGRFWWYRLVRLIYSSVPDSRGRHYWSGYQYKMVVYLNTYVIYKLVFSSTYFFSSQTFFLSPTLRYTWVGIFMISLYSLFYIFVVHMGGKELWPHVVFFCLHWYWCLLSIQPK